MPITSGKMRWLILKQLKVKEMVDYYAYKIKASEIRYDYLLRKAKENMAQ